jgi:FAD synthase
MRVVDWSRFLTGDLAKTLPPGSKTAMTVGVFDGVHRGHRALIEAICRRGPDHTPTVVSFRRSPKELLRPREWQGDILSLGRRLAIFEDLGVGAVVLIDFSADFSRLGGNEFIALLRRWGNLGYMALGGHFRCGYALDTGAAEIKAVNASAGVPTEVLALVRDGDEPVSSSRIRQAIRGGDLSRAKALLGRDVEIDFSDMAAESREGGAFFYCTASPRVLPPPGWYPALLYGGQAGAGIKTEIRIQGGGVFTPLPASPRGAADGAKAFAPPERGVFYTSSQGE